MSDKPDLGYREQIKRRPPAPGAVGELLEPTDADKALLDASRARERTRAYGMFIAAGALWRLAPFLPRIPAFTIGTIVVAIALLIGSFFAFFAPPGVGAILFRLSSREVVAGRKLSAVVVVRPRASRLALDPVIVRLVALRAEAAGPVVAYESKHVLAERQAVEGGDAVRLETTFELAEDAPASSPKAGVRWQVELTIGPPANVKRTLALRVLPSTRRRAAKGRGTRAERLLD